MRILSGHQSNYLPYPGLFFKIAKSDGFIFVDHVQFERKSWQNRNRIRIKEEWVYLTVPVITKGKFDQCILDVRINEDSAWKEKHLQSIWLHYHKAPYYNEISNFIEEYYSKSYQGLAELNRAFIISMLKLLEINTPIFFSESLKLSSNKTHLLVDMCKALNFDGYLSNEGSKAYVEEEIFEQNSLFHQYCDYTTPHYIQQYKGFIPNLSIIDMLANVGISMTKNYIADGGNIK